ncbi:MAG: alpha/beta fold hydrolase [Chromatiales bacterium]|nr:alpha/beta fold hydrolase [Chromatiales bacterium]
MKLNYREYGSYHESRSTLVFLHGLLGSSVNWHGIVRALESDYHILVPDLRNHGQSPHSDDVSYQSMATDVAELLDDQGLESATLIGHSMGGKVAMWLALSQPQWIDQLAVVDIAPVSYPNRFSKLFEALQSVDLANLESRQHADQQLARYLTDFGLRQYLLQNLMLDKDRWCWRVNLIELASQMPEIIAFPDIGSTAPFLGETLFIYGGNSDYLAPAYEGQVRELFPYARLRSIAGAGHWVYAEQPQLFLGVLKGFLGDTD